MSKTKDFIVSIEESRFRNPQNNLILDLYESGVSLFDGTIIGTQVINGNGDLAVGIPQVTLGDYKFVKIPFDKLYSIVISGLGITTQIPDKLTDIDIGLPYNVTGSDLPYKNNTNISIQDAIENLDSTSQIPRITVLENDVDTLFNYNTGKTVETILKTGGIRVYLTIQEAINDAFTNGGNVLVHEKVGVYNEAVTLANGVNIHLEGNSIIETNLNAPSFTANNVNCVISGEGQIKNIYNGATKREAFRILNNSNITIKNKYLYARGSSTSTQGSTVYVSDSIVNLFPDKIENLYGSCVYFDTGSSGMIKNINDKIISNNCGAIYIDSAGDIDIINTKIYSSSDGTSLISGGVTINSLGGNLFIEDTIFENINQGNTIYGIHFLNADNTVIISGVECNVNVNGFPFHCSDGFQDLYIRKPSWGNLDIDRNNLTINIKGLWNYGYD